MGSEGKTTVTTKASFASTLRAKLRLAGPVHVYFARFATPAASEPMEDEEPLSEDADEADADPPQGIVVIGRYRRPLRTGWLYVWLPSSRVWHEYEVTVREGRENDVRKHLKRVEWKELGKDVRPATGAAQTLVRLPRTEVQVAFSEIQWSWERISQIEGDAEMRSARMRTLDLGQAVPAGSPYDDDADVHEIEHFKDLALGLTDACISRIKAEVKANGLTAVAATIDDLLAMGRQRAGNYQAMWRLMDERMTRITAHPWYAAAALTMGVLGRARYDEDLRKQSEGIDRRKVRAVLQSNWRSSLRRAIRKHKGRLVDLLDGEAHRKGVCEAIRDYLALPVDPGVKGGPCFSDGWSVAENLIARLGDHEATRDAHLEPDPVKLAKQAQRDRGRMLLAKIADPDGGHPLHGIVFPPAATPSSEASHSKPGAKMDRSAQSLQVQRRTWEALFKFVSHFSSLEEQKPREAVVDLLVKAGVNLRMANITLGELVGDKAKGDGTAKPPTLDPDDYLIRTTIEEDIALNGSKAAKKRLRRHRGALLDLPSEGDGGITRTHVRAYEVGADGQKVLVGAVSLEDFKAGEGLGKSRWAKVRKQLTRPEKWRVARVKVVVFTKPRRGFQRWVYNQKSAQMGLGAAFAVLEGWNLTESYKQFCAAEGRGGRADWEFLGNMMDATSALAEMVSATHARFAVKPGNVRFARFVRLAGTQTFKVGAGVLGVAGGVLSVGLSVVDTVKNAAEGDDAAVGHAILVVGFALGAWSGAAAAGFVASGPPGWICAVVLFVGAVLVYCLENTPFEDWVNLGPFRKGVPALKADPAYAKAAGDRPSWNHPVAAAEALLDALYKPNLQVVLEPESQELLPSFGVMPVIEDIGNLARVELTLPYFIDGSSLLYLNLRWIELPFFGSDKTLSDSLTIRAIEAKDIAYTVQLDIPEALRRRHRELRADGKSLLFKLEARLRIDMRGDGRLWSPRRSAGTLSGGAVKDGDWLIHSATDRIRE